MTAREVKDALRRRHPAQWKDNPHAPGQWTCIEEWRNVDLLAFSAWGDGSIIGYEVKVSRSDYRRELLAPAKRREAVESCHEFYFAVPAGTLRPAEKQWEESLWDDGDFERVKCENCRKPERFERRAKGYVSRVSVERARAPVPCVLPPLPDWEVANLERHAGTPHGERLLARRTEEDLSRHGWTAIPCRACDGKGYTRGSRVEREAPQLWIPRDVGLVEVAPDGTSRAYRKAPRGRPTREIAPSVGDLVRWVSVRPDPRHVAMRAPSMEAVA